MSLITQFRLKKFLEKADMKYRKKLLHRKNVKFTAYHISNIALKFPSNYIQNFMKIYIFFTSMQLKKTDKVKAGNNVSMQ